MTAPWDQAPWGPPPAPAPGPVPDDRPAAWLVGLVWGAVSLPVLSIVHINLGDDGNAAYRGGQAVTMAVATGVLVGLAALAERRVRSWWVSGLVAVVAAALVYLALAVLPELEERAEAEERVGEPRDEPADTADRVVVAAPSFTGFRALEGPAVQERRRAIEERVAETEDLEVDGVVYAEYAVAGGRVGLFFLNGIGRDGSGSSAQALVDYLAGAGIEEYDEVDPGPLGGSMACTDRHPQLPDGVVYCAWSDSAGTGDATWGVRGLGVERAAEATRLLRDGVTER